jgi:hypothetical protein
MDEIVPFWLFTVVMTMDRKGPNRMKRSSVALFTGAVAALLFAGPSARADFVQWRYNWTPSTLKVVSDTSPTTFVQLTNEPIGKPSVQVSGDSDIQMTNVKVFSDAARANPDKFDASLPVNFLLRITDVASGAFTDLPFQVKFKGDVSADSSHLRVDFLGATAYNDVHLGNNIYTVDGLSFTQPGPPGSDNSGSIAASVTVRPLDIQKAPEPSTMVLSTVGLSFLGLASWRKRRQKALVVA